MAENKCQVQYISQKTVKTDNGLQISEIQVNFTWSQSDSIFKDMKNYLKFRFFK